MVYDTGTVGCPNLAFTCWQMGHCTNSLAAAWYSPVSVTSPATHKINLSISKEVYIDLTRVSTVLTFVSSNITSCCSDIYALPFMPVYPQYYIIITMFPRGGRGWKVLDEQLRGEEKKGGGLLKWKPGAHGFTQVCDLGSQTFCSTPYNTSWAL